MCNYVPRSTSTSPTIGAYAKSEFGKKKKATGNIKSGLQHAAYAEYVM